MRRHDLAQLNVARLRAPTDSPLAAEFMDAPDPINGLADASPGFVWRFQTDSGNATDETLPGQTLAGDRVRLRRATNADTAALVEIRQRPEVLAWWRGGEDLAAAVADDLAEKDSTSYVIELDNLVVGWIQWQAEDEPDYRHAGIDIYVDPAVHGRDVGTDAVRTVARHLIVDHGHHRITIDPAADNAAAIRCYTKVGFRAVGVERQSERGSDGIWHDSLLMDLLAAELTTG